MVPLFTATAAMTVVVAGTGTALAVPGRTPHTGAPACTDSWKQQPFQNVGNWNTAKNWTKGVPARNSDVCIEPHVLVRAPATVTVHSLQVGDATVAFGNAKTNAGHVTITTALIIGPGNGTVEPNGVTLTAASITDDGAIASSGHAVVTSPALSNDNDGIVAVNSGTLTLTDPPAQLRHGALTGGTWQIFGGGIMRLPTDVAALGAGATLVIPDAGSQLTDLAGNNALAGLTSIATGATLTIGGNGGSVAVDGNLTCAGTIFIGNVTQGAGTLTVAGTLTEAKDCDVELSVGILAAASENIGAGARLDAVRGILGPVDNAGMVTVDGGTRVSGDYTQAPGGVLSVGFKFATMAVTGKATLAGVLETGSSPQSPVPGTRSTVLTFGSRHGTFTSHSLGFNLVTGATRLDAVAQPQIAAPASARAGGTVTVSGGDFQFGGTIGIFLDKASGTPLATATPAPGGSFQQKVTIPAKTSAGKHTLIAVGINGRTAKQPIRITG